VQYYVIDNSNSSENNTIGCIHGMFNAVNWFVLLPLKLSLLKIWNLLLLLLTVDVVTATSEKAARFNFKLDIIPRSLDLGLNFTFDDFVLIG
jgi:hypothetical protein